MTYFQIDDRLTDRPSLSALTADGWCMVLHMLCYAAGNETDGHVPHARIPRLAPVADPHATITELAACGYIEGDAVNGWRIVDYLDLNKSASEIGRARAASRNRVRKHRATKSDGHPREGQPPTVTSNADGNALHANYSGVSNACVTDPDTDTYISSSESDLRGLSTTCGKDDDDDGATVRADAARIVAARRTAARDVGNPTGYAATIAASADLAEELDRAIAANPDADAETIAAIVDPPAVPAATARRSTPGRVDCDRCHGTHWATTDDGCVPCDHTTSTETGLEAPLAAVLPLRAT